LPEAVVGVGEPKIERLELEGLELEGLELEGLELEEPPQPDKAKGVTEKTNKRTINK
jgi:hypothetical protein